jgi:hypothetical protein
MRWLHMNYSSDLYVGLLLAGLHSSTLLVSGFVERPPRGCQMSLVTANLFDLEAAMKLLVCLIGR